jgi:hypothetical protein
MLTVSGSICCSRSWQTIRAGSVDCPRGADQPVVHRVLHDFLRHFVLIHRVGRFQLEQVCRSVRPGLPDSSRGSDCPWGGHGPSVFRGAVLVFRVA